MFEIRDAPPRDGAGPDAAAEQGKLVLIGRGLDAAAFGASLRHALRV